MSTLISQCIEETLEESLGAEEHIERVYKQRRLDEIIRGTLWKDEKKDRKQGSERERNTERRAA